MQETTKKTLVLIMVIAIISYFVAMIAVALSKDSQNMSTNEGISSSQLDTCLDSAYKNYKKLWDEAAEENGTPGKVSYLTGMRLDRSYENQKEDCYRYEEVTR